MRGATNTLLLLTLALAACQPVAVAPRAEEPVSVRRKAPPKATPSPAEPVAALAAATPAPSATPAVPMTRLTGKVLVDAAYLVSAGVGSLVSNNGSSVVAVGAGHIISANGAGLVSNNGGGIISANGASLVSNNSGSLLGKVKAPAALVAADGSFLRILSAVAPGTLLPAQGLAVVPASLKTGRQIGEPVFTDATGAYTVAIPESTEGNVVLLAQVPAKSESDPVLEDERLSYTLLVEPQDAETWVIDEDSALVTDYVRRGFRGRLRQILVAPTFDEIEALVVKEYLGPELLKAAMLGMLRELWDEAQKAGTRSWPEAAVSRLAVRISDIVQAQLDFDAIQFKPELYPGWNGPVEPSLPALAELMGHTREKAAAKMEAEPEFFRSQPYILEANERRQGQGLPPYAILKPSDINDFIVSEYLAANVSLPSAKVQTVLESFDAEDGPTGQISLRLMANASSVLAAIVQTLVLDKNGAKTDALAEIRTFEP